MSRPVIARERLAEQIIRDPGPIVKAIRLRHGYTARRLATEIGLGPAFFYRLEAEEDVGMTIATAARILDWFDTHPLPRPCSERPDCWRGKDHDGPHEDHS